MLKERVLKMLTEVIFQVTVPASTNLWPKGLLNKRLEFCHMLNTAGRYTVLTFSVSLVS